MYVEQLLLRYWQRGSACASTTSYIVYVTVINFFYNAGKCCVRNSEWNVKIILAWIPGHQRIELNEFADILAKEAARDIYTGRLIICSQLCHLQ